MNSVSESTLSVKVAGAVLESVKPEGVAPAVSGPEANQIPVQENQLNLERLAAKLEQFQSRLAGSGHELKLHVDEETMTVQAEIVDTTNQRVLRKIPPDELVKLAASLKKGNVALDKSI